MKADRILWLMVLALFGTVVALTAALAAYSSHQNDQDVHNFLAVYPFAKSTKLDDCALCHPGGKIGSKTYGSCDYCHQTYGLHAPHLQPVPLNSYGQAYLDEGRNQDALMAIENSNLDGDAYTNIQEIQSLTFPGDGKDYPGLVPAPAVGMNFERILKLPGYSEFLLLNASKSQDFYARYRGVRIMDLLKYARVSKTATQITVFSPDGFSQVFPIDAPDPQTDPKSIQYDVMGPYPYGTYYAGLDFVDYPSIPGCLDDGDRIPDKLYMLLAYMRNGDPLTPGKIDPATLKLDGEGPYRLIPPQKIAGSPDRPAAAPGDELNYDASKDHNAGFSARTVAAIRVDPLPAGTTDFNWYEGGWNLVDRAKLVIYGAINPRTYPVEGRVTDESGKPIADVKITFSLLSLGQVGEVTTSSYKGRFKKNAEGGKFYIDLPAGEYTVVPLKDGCTFTPAPLSISLPDSECDSDPDHSGDWGRQDYCKGHPDNGISIVGSCD
jgi:hypothetical protein